MGFEILAPPAPDRFPPFARNPESHNLHVDIILIERLGFNQDPWVLK
jgi:hypothetical protein